MPPNQDGGGQGGGAPPNQDPTGSQLPVPRIVAAGAAIVTGACAVYSCRSAAPTKGAASAGAAPVTEPPKTGNGPPPAPKDPLSSPQGGKEHSNTTPEAHAGKEHSNTTTEHSNTSNDWHDPLGLRRWVEESLTAEDFKKVKDMVDLSVTGYALCWLQGVIGCCVWETTELVEVSAPLNDSQVVLNGNR